MRGKIITSLKTMLTFAQARGLVAQNVALGVRIKSDNRHAAPCGPASISRRWRNCIPSLRILRHGAARLSSPRSSPGCGLANCAAFGGPTSTSRPA